MPPGHGTEGLEAAQQIRERWPSVGLLLLSQYVEAHYALLLMTEFEGGVGYLLKDRVSDLETFAQDVRRVATGATVIDPELVASLVARRREKDPLESLSNRERDVLSLMAQGMSNAALADELHLSPKTIESYVTSIFTKLGLAPDTREHRRVLAVLTFLRA
jgi:DNA-binding NarL/FixJ family response regulator